MSLLLDSLEVTVIIDNELDVMSPPPPTTMGTIYSHGSLGNIARESALVHDRGGEDVRELRMDRTIGWEKRSVLFDTGPEEDIWERNAKRLGVDLAGVEAIVLSHWHRDHSGGMLRAIRMIKEAQEAHGDNIKEVVVDVHPSRPKYRGFQLGEEIISLEADPGFDEMAAAGATVSKNAQAHTLAGGMFHVSGMIPRETEYETGLRGGMRFEDEEEDEDDDDKREGRWKKDEEIADERVLTCRVRGLGLVVVTGCSHAGVVNTARHARREQRDKQGKEEDIFAIIGGYHLATSDEATMLETVHDLAAMNPRFLVPGHCSGWRVKMAIEQAMPGRLLPCSVGARLLFADQPS
ncbi:metallo-beta-lactamase [Arthroderma uncinatum]|uniref:metallo-beta-lactamase n=1 Tax=Arthroderma uncinatum TaxID=74035 RepID=UPI00144A5520|nr:metallo-beta-lactamase [Arthroderma uncinatum]KAF3491101.1 metallo-beta-lactamase [Arthroderma uncinatum]